MCAPYNLDYVQNWGWAELDVEAEKHDISLLHDVLLAFLSQESLFLDGGERAELEQIVTGDRFSADEAALKVPERHTRRVE